MLIEVPPATSANFSGERIGLRDVRGHFVPAADQGFPKRPEPRALPLISMWPSNACMQSRITDSPRPSPWPKHSQRLTGCRSRGTKDVLQPECDALRPGRPSVRSVVRQTHGVGTVGITDRFDVRVFVNVDAGADGDALGQIVAATRHTHSDERLGIGAHVFSQIAR